MRTNKKCPLYKEEGEPVAWQDLGAAAEGLVERQGTKITIKRKLPTKPAEEVAPSIPAQPPIVYKTPVMKKDPKPTPPTKKFPSLKFTLSTASGGHNTGNGTPASADRRPVVEKPEKVHPVDANGTREPSVSQPAKSTVFKLKVSNQKLKERELLRSKKEQEAAEERERERMRRDQEAYEAALLEEREREERELERQEAAAATPKANGLEVTVGKKIKRMVFVNKSKKPKVVSYPKDDAEVLRRREREHEQAERREQEREREERQREAQEYEWALAEELKREEDELEQKLLEQKYAEEKKIAERDDRERRERDREKLERDQERHQMREKERKRERERLEKNKEREKAIRMREAREAREREAAELERQAREREERELLQAREAARQQQERERLREKQAKLKRVKERQSVNMSTPVPVLSEKDRGKAHKRHYEVPAPMYHQHTPETGNAPKRIRKRGGEVSFLMSPIWSSDL